MILSIFFLQGQAHSSFITDILLPQQQAGEKHINSLIYPETQYSLSLLICKDFFTWKKWIR